MKRILLVASLMILANAFQLNAQIDFESLEMPTYKNGSNGAGSFTQGELKFVNYYNSDWNSWAGFAVSKAMDTETSGSGNQYSSIVGEGAESSDNYMVSYVSSMSGTTYFTLDAPQTLSSFKVTNNTYTYNSMRDGDNYSIKFGGEDGNDEDWYLLTITGYNGDLASTEAVEFYLADFRFEDNAEDYIVNTWETIDLTPLGEVDSLVFSLSSTDNGEYGMNTPSYFCLDNIVTATETIDFETYDFDYWNGEDLSGGFTLPGGMGSEAYFQNSFTPSAYGGYWSGFAYSQKTDITTEGLSNQYSSFAGSGNNGSDIYVVSFNNSGIKFIAPTVALEINVSNSTYAALSMQNGDSFAKKFGGEDGNDPDWFMLTIESFNNNVSKGAKEFYLADYRFEDNSQDYILEGWETIHFDFEGQVDSLSFSLSSSDNGEWGMNTPGYFCIDDINLTHVGIKEINTTAFNVYPNPTQDIMRIQAEDISEVSITDLSGKLIFKQNTNTTDLSIDLSSFNKGIYILSVISDSKSYTQKIIKE